jgi:hypothetical protein
MQTSIARPEKLILVDCDDVLLDWLSGFRDFCSHALGRKIEGFPGEWKMHSWLEIEPDDVKRLILEFNDGAPEFGALPPTNNAENVIPALAADGWRFLVVTSCSASRKVVELRRRNLAAVFGDVFEDVVCLDLGTPKTDVLSTLPPSWWVEDNYRNACDGASVGHRPVMLRKKHNADFEADDRLCVWTDDWTDAIASMGLVGT